MENENKTIQPENTAIYAMHVMSEIDEFIRGKVRDGRIFRPRRQHDNQHHHRRQCQGDLYDRPAVAYSPVSLTIIYPS